MKKPASCVSGNLWETGLCGADGVEVVLRGRTFVLEAVSLSFSLLSKLRKSFCCCCFAVVCF